MIEEIIHNKELLAIIIRSNYSPDGVKFITQEKNFLQVGILIHKEGAAVKPHYHNEIERSISITQEVLHIEYGKMESVFYYKNEQVLSSIIHAGDTLVLISGGHAFKIMEDTKIIEVKQGPFISTEKDKTLL